VPRPRHCPVDPDPHFKAAICRPDIVAEMRKILGLALVLVVVATGCGTSSPRDKWDAANVRNYSMTVQLSAMVGQASYTVRVVNGMPNASPEWQPWGTHPQPRPLTVGDLFAAIDDTADVTYDEYLSFPRQINFNADTPTVSDDEWSYTVTGFEVNE
jgi:Family of unknown function (DUF6174)